MAAAGTDVNVRSFNGSFTGASTPGRTGVIIRDGSRTGRIIRPGAITPDGRGNINETVTLPADLTPGWHLIVATQTVESTGRQVGFTPARTRILVTAAAAGSAAPGGGGSPGSPLVPWAVGLSALALLAAGATLTARRLRTLNRPPLGS